MLKILAQGVSILVSILAAFAIDAWWTETQEHEKYLGQLDTVAIELAAAQRDLSKNEKQLESIRIAVASLLELAKPEPEPIVLEELSRLLDLSFRHGIVELRSGAVIALISSGNIGEVENPELMALLAGWPSRIAKLRNQTEMLEDDREELIVFLHARIPTLEIAHNTGQMDHYPRSDFSADPVDVLGQMEFEGRLGNRGMMVEDSLSIIWLLHSESERILKLIQEER